MRSALERILLRLCEKQQAYIKYLLCADSYVLQGMEHTE